MKSQLLSVCAFNIQLQNRQYKYELIEASPVTHICINKLRTVSSDNGLSSIQNQTITQTNAD